MYYKIYDNVEKTYFGFGACYDTVKKAEKARWDYLQKGNYPDRPISVLSIYKFNNGRFVEVVS